MLALISDIHGNKEALEAVLADIDEREVETIFCLGDMVGYGPDPAACVALVLRRCELTLTGNHEQGMLADNVAFSDSARASLAFARRQLQPAWYSLPGKRKRWAQLQRLPLQHETYGALLVHGSPRDPVNEYLLERDCRLDKNKLREALRRVDGLLFCGHTHSPGAINERLAWRSPSELDDLFICPAGEKAIVNVGSVGQPRDGDPRACYALFDGDRTVEWVRLDYDRETTMAKIRANPVLDDHLADRLAQGR